MLQAKFICIFYCFSKPFVNGGLKSLQKQKNKSPNDRRKSTQGRQCHQPYHKAGLPYGKDCNIILDKLNMSSEICKCQSCSCNAKQKSLRSLNLAQACDEIRVKSPSSKKLIREAKLKLHHREKDHRGVLRAARLRYIKYVQKPYRKSCANIASPCNPTPLKTGSITKDTIFGNAQQNSLELNSLAVKSSDQHGMCFAGESFCQQRDSLSNESVQASGVVDTQCQQDESNKPCSCAQQALLDDWTVDELACYFEDYVHIPKKMSLMAEMMYT